MPDALSALKWIQKISNKRYTHSNESDKLRAYISKWSMQSIDNTNKEQFIGENCLEESANPSNLPLLSEWGVEEDVSN